MHLSQLTLKRAEMQMSTLYSHQCSNNTTILCIWAWNRCRPSVWKRLQERKTVLKYNFSLTKSSQQRKTASPHKTPIKNIVLDSVWLFLIRFPPEQRLLVEALYQGSTNFFIRGPHDLLHKFEGRTSYVMWLFRDMLHFTKSRNSS